MGIVLAVFGALFLWRQRDVFIVLFGLSAFFLIFGFLLPVALKPIQKLWMSFAIIVGWFMSRVLLTILFYLVVTPIGLVSRLFGKDFLNNQDRGNSDSCWIPVDSKVKDKKSYEKQF